MPYKNKEQPKLARISKHFYQFYLFCMTLTDDELQMLYKKRMVDLKYISGYNEVQRLRTEMKIITWAFSETKDI